MLQIQLQDTLSDFYMAEESYDQSAPSVEAFISYNPISNNDLSSQLKRNTKYANQQWRSVDNDCAPETNLILMAQRMAWNSGKLSVVFFKPDVPEGPETLAMSSSVEEDLELTRSILDPDCRFVPVFCESPQQCCDILREARVAAFLPSEHLASLDHVVDIDKHYMLLSKRALALSDLPTPRAQLVDFTAPSAGWTTSNLDREIAKAVAAIHGCDPLFKLKSNSAGGGKGTYLIPDASSRAIVEGQLADILREELPSLNASNAYLHPFSLIITEYLPGNTISINFYVHKDGNARFSSYVTQVLSEQGNFWLGAEIVYSAQAEFARKYNKLIKRTAKFLHCNGYYGPVGIDIMTNRAGVYNIVDLNPRPTGSFVLGCLRHHFHDNRGMNIASVTLFIEHTAKRSQFMDSFQIELQEGKIVVIAWYSNPRTARCSMCLAVSAIDKITMKKLYENILLWVASRQNVEE